MGRESLQSRRSGRVYHPSKKALRLGYLAGLVSRLSRGSRSRVTGSDLKRRNFATSTQRLGVRFSELIRATFRFRWLNKL